MIYSPNSESRIRAHISHLERGQRIKEGERKRALFEQLERDEHRPDGDRVSLIKRLWRRIIR